jgi:hypothetical protein
LSWAVDAALEYAPTGNNTKLYRTDADGVTLVPSNGVQYCGHSAKLKVLTAVGRLKCASDGVNSDHTFPSKTPDNSIPYPCVRKDGEQLEEVRNLLNISISATNDFPSRHEVETRVMGGKVDDSESESKSYYGLHMCDLKGATDCASQANCYSDHTCDITGTSSNAIKNKNWWFPTSEWPTMPGSCSADGVPNIIEDMSTAKLLRPYAADELCTEANPCTATTSSFHCYDNGYEQDKWTWHERFDRNETVTRQTVVSYSCDSLDVLPNASLHPDRQTGFEPDGAGSYLWSADESLRLTAAAADYFWNSSNVYSFLYSPMAGGGKAMTGTAGGSSRAEAVGTGFLLWRDAGDATNSTVRTLAKEKLATSINAAICAAGGCNDADLTPLSLRGGDTTWVLPITLAQVGMISNWIEKTSGLPDSGWPAWLLRENWRLHDGNRSSMATSMVTPLELEPFYWWSKETAEAPTNGFELGSGCATKLTRSGTCELFASGYQVPVSAALSLWSADQPHSFLNDEGLFDWIRAGLYVDRSKDPIKSVAVAYAWSAGWTAETALDMNSARGLAATCAQEKVCATLDPAECEACSLKAQAKLAASLNSLEPVRSGDQFRPWMAMVTRWLYRWIEHDIPQRDTLQRWLDDRCLPDDVLSTTSSSSYTSLASVSAYHPATLSIDGMLPEKAVWNTFVNQTTYGYVSIRNLTYYTNGFSWKQPVKCASDSAMSGFTFSEPSWTADSAGAFELDGITTVAENRVLIKNEAGTSAVGNGIFTVSYSGSNVCTLTRADDANSGAEMPQSAVRVQLGTTPRIGSSWVLTNSGAITLGTTQQAWATFSPKQPVRCATVSAMSGFTFSEPIWTATSAGTFTIDGIATVSTDRVLIKDEAGTSAIGNGIFTVSYDGANMCSLTRAGDANSDAEMPQASVFVQSGANVESIWVLTNLGAITLGTTEQAWDMFAINTTYWRRVPDGSSYFALSGATETPVGVASTASGGSRGRVYANISPMITYNKSVHRVTRTYSWRGGDGAGQWGRLEFLSKPGSNRFNDAYLMETTVEQMLTAYSCDLQDTLPDQVLGHDYPYVATEKVKTVYGPRAGDNRYTLFPNTQSGWELEPKRAAGTSAQLTIDMAVRLFDATNDASLLTEDGFSKWRRSLLDGTPRCSYHSTDPVCRGFNNASTAAAAAALTHDSTTSTAIKTAIDAPCTTGSCNTFGNTELSLVRGWALAWASACDPATGLGASASSSTSGVTVAVPCSAFAREQMQRAWATRTSASFGGYGVQGSPFDLDPTRYGTTSLPGVQPGFEVDFSPPPVANPLIVTAAGPSTRPSVPHARYLWDPQNTYSFLNAGAAYDLKTGGPTGVFAWKAVLRGVDTGAEHFFRGNSSSAVPSPRLCSTAGGTTVARIMEADGEDAASAEFPASVIAEFSDPAFATVIKCVDLPGSRNRVVSPSLFNTTVSSIAEAANVSAAYKHAYNSIATATNSRPPCLQSNPVVHYHLNLSLQVSGGAVCGAQRFFSLHLGGQQTGLLPYDATAAMVREALFGLDVQQLRAKVNSLRSPPISNSNFSFLAVHKFARVGCNWTFTIDANEKWPSALHSPSSLYVTVAGTPIANDTLVALKPTLTTTAGLQYAYADRLNRLPIADGAMHWNRVGVSPNMSLASCAIGARSPYDDRWRSYSGTAINCDALVTPVTTPSGSVLTCSSRGVCVAYTSVPTMLQTPTGGSHPDRKYGFDTGTSALNGGSQPVYRCLCTGMGSSSVSTTSITYTGPTCSTPVDTTGTSTASMFDDTPESCAIAEMDPPDWVATWTLAGYQFAATLDSANSYQGPAKSAWPYPTNLNISTGYAQSLGVSRAFSARVLVVGVGTSNTNSTPYPCPPRNGMNEEQVSVVAEWFFSWTKSEIMHEYVQRSWLALQVGSEQQISGAIDRSNGYDGSSVANATAARRFMGLPTAAPTSSISSGLHAGGDISVAPFDLRSGGLPLIDHSQAVKQAVVESAHIPAGFPLAASPGTGAAMVGAEASSSATNGLAHSATIGFEMNVARLNLSSTHMQYLWNPTRPMSFLNPHALDTWRRAHRGLAPESSLNPAARYTHAGDDAAVAEIQLATCSVCKCTVLDKKANLNNGTGFNMSVTYREGTKSRVWVHEWQFRQTWYEVNTVSSTAGGSAGTATTNTSKGRKLASNGAGGEWDGVPSLDNLEDGDSWAGPMGLDEATTDDRHRRLRGAHDSRSVESRSILNMFRNLAGVTSSSLIVTSGVSNTSNITTTPTGPVPTAKATTAPTPSPTRMNGPLCAGCVVHVHVNSSSCLITSNLTRCIYSNSSWYPMGAPGSEYLAVTVNHTANQSVYVPPTAAATIEYFGGASSAFALSDSGLTGGAATKAASANGNTVQVVIKVVWWVEGHSNTAAPTSMPTAVPDASTGPIKRVRYWKLNESTTTTMLARPCPAADGMTMEQVRGVADWLLGMTVHPATLSWLQRRWWSTSAEEVGQREHWTPYEQGFSLQQVYDGERFMSDMSRPNLGGEADIGGGGVESGAAGGYSSAYSARTLGPTNSSAAGLFELPAAAAAALWDPASGVSFLDPVSFEALWLPLIDTHPSSTRRVDMTYVRQHQQAMVALGSGITTADLATFAHPSNYRHYLNSSIASTHRAVPVCCDGVHVDGVHYGGAGSAIGGSSAVGGGGGGDFGGAKAILPEGWQIVAALIPDGYRTSVASAVAVPLYTHPLPTMIEKADNTTYPLTWQGGYSSYDSFDSGSSFAYGGEVRPEYRRPSNGNTSDSATGVNAHGFPTGYVSALAMDGGRPMAHLLLWLRSWAVSPYTQQGLRNQFRSGTADVGVATTIAPTNASTEATAVVVEAEDVALSAVHEFEALMDRYDLLRDSQFKHAPKETLPSGMPDRPEGCALLCMSRGGNCGGFGIREGEQYSRSCWFNDGKESWVEAKAAVPPRFTTGNNCVDDPEDFADSLGTGCKMYTYPLAQTDLNTQYTAGVITLLQEEAFGKPALCTTSGGLGFFWAAYPKYDTEDMEQFAGFIETKALRRHDSSDAKEPAIFSNNMTLLGTTTPFAKYAVYDFETRRKDDGLDGPAPVLAPFKVAAAAAAAAAAADSTHTVEYVGQAVPLGGYERVPVREYHAQAACCGCGGGRKVATHYYDKRIGSAYVDSQAAADAARTISVAEAVSSASTRGWSTGGVKHLGYGAGATEVQWSHEYSHGEQYATSATAAATSSSAAITVPNVAPKYATVARALVGRPQCTDTEYGYDSRSGVRSNTIAGVCQPGFELTAARQAWAQVSVGTGTENRSLALAGLQQAIQLAVTGGYSGGVNSATAGAIGSTVVSASTQYDSASSSQKTAATKALKELLSVGPQLAALLWDPASSYSLLSADGFVLWTEGLEGCDSTAYTATTTDGRELPLCKEEDDEEEEPDMISVASSRTNGTMAARVPADSINSTNITNSTDNNTDSASSSDPAVETSRTATVSAAERRAAARRRRTAALNFLHTLVKPYVALRQPLRVDEAAEAQVDAIRHWIRLWLDNPSLWRSNAMTAQFAKNGTSASLLPTSSSSSSSSPSAGADIDRGNLTQLGYLQFGSGAVSLTGWRARADLGETFSQRAAVHSMNLVRQRLFWQPDIISENSDTQPVVVGSAGCRPLSRCGSDPNDQTSYLNPETSYGGKPSLRSLGLDAGFLAGGAWSEPTTASARAGYHEISAFCTTGTNASVQATDGAGRDWQSASVGKEIVAAAAVGGYYNKPWRRCSTQVSLERALMLIELWAHTAPVSDAVQAAGLQMTVGQLAVMTFLDQPYDTQAACELAVATVRTEALRWGLAVSTATGVETATKLCELAVVVGKETPAETRAPTYAPSASPTHKPTVGAANVTNSSIDTSRNITNTPTSSPTPAPTSGKYSRRASGYWAVRFFLGPDAVPSAELAANAIETVAWVQRMIDIQLYLQYVATRFELLTRIVPKGGGYFTQQKAGDLLFDGWVDPTVAKLRARGVTAVVPDEEADGKVATARRYSYFRAFHNMTSHVMERQIGGKGEVHAGVVEVSAEQAGAPTDAVPASLQAVRDAKKNDLVMDGMTPADADAAVLAGEKALGADGKKLEVNVSSVQWDWLSTEGKERLRTVGQMLEWGDGYVSVDYSPSDYTPSGGSSGSAVGNVTYSPTSSPTTAAAIGDGVDTGGASAVINGKAILTDGSCVTPALGDLEAEDRTFEPPSLVGAWCHETKSPLVFTWVGATKAVLARAAGSLGTETEDTGGDQQRYQVSLRKFVLDKGALPVLLRLDGLHGNVPLALSSPHFLTSQAADRAYATKLRSAVKGLQQVQARHESRLDIEPVSGLTFSIKRRLQYNCRLDSTAVWYRNKMTDPLSVTPWLPLYWFEEGGAINAALAKEFKEKVYEPLWFKKKGAMAMMMMGGLASAGATGSAVMNLKAANDARQAAQAALAAAEMGTQGASAASSAQGAYTAVMMG